jgi:ribonucleoside-diphosphate reductase alpha chain
MDLYQQYIHISRYSRWRDDVRRRETWPETVRRYVSFFDRRTFHEFAEVMDTTIYDAILNLEVMPSMRALMTAGEALERENLAGYNCAYLAINSKRSFAETLYLLMCGTGVGFSCERQEIAKLPIVPKSFEATNDLVVVGDSKFGWAKAYYAYLCHLWDGDVPQVDYTKVRPAGARLKTFGGRASGPAVLTSLFDTTRQLFLKAAGRKLTSIEVHDLMCTIGEIVVVGGVRRSALISLSNLSDQRMRDAKTGQWWSSNPQRAMANNSVCYTEKPGVEIFTEEWLALIRSKSGERGIFNRVAAAAQASRWGRRSAELDYGCNPCSEIILRDRQLCNLSEVIVRADDTVESLRRKVGIATVLGTLQATLTDFKFVGEAWIRNTREEALLGVSLTGIMDSQLTNGMGPGGHEALADLLRDLRDHARAVNALWSKRLDIAESAAITCVKPSGTVSQLCNTASGIHARHSPQYIRRVRIDKRDVLYRFMVQAGFYVEDDLAHPYNVAVVSFPIQAPPAAVCRKDVTALEALELWLLYQREWCEHKPSATINVREDEFLDVGAWVYRHFDEVSGISFLPFSDHVYQQAPYTDMDSASFRKWCQEHPTPEVNWDDLPRLEDTDNTVGAQTLACTGGVCEI